MVAYRSQGNTMRVISVYAPLVTGTYKVSWDPVCAHTTIVHVRRTTRGYMQLIQPGVGMLIMRAYEGSTFADYMRILNDDECIPGSMGNRHPKGRWHGVTKVVV